MQPPATQDRPQAERPALTPLVPLEGTTWHEVDFMLPTGSREPERRSGRPVDWGAPRRSPLVDANSPRSSDLDSDVAPMIVITADGQTMELPRLTLGDHAPQWQAPQRTIRVRPGVEIAQDPSLDEFELSTRFQGLMPSRDVDSDSNPESQTLSIASDDETDAPASS